MHAIVSFTLVPIDAAISVSPYVLPCEKIFGRADLNFEVNGNGTNAEGEWDQLFGGLRRCYETVHGTGAPGIHTVSQLGTGADRNQRLSEKFASVAARRDSWCGSEAGEVRGSVESMTGLRGATVAKSQRGKTVVEPVQGGEQA